MSDAREKLSTQALTEEEERKFLEAIKRTQEETAPPPGMNVDVGAIAAKAFASYLDGLSTAESSALKDPAKRVSWTSLDAPDPEIASALSSSSSSIQRTIGEMMEQEPSVQFRREFFYTVIPTVVLAVLAAGYLLFKSRVNLPFNLLAQILAVCTVLAALALTIGFLIDMEAISARLRSFRYSGGSLVGGLAVAALGLLFINYGFQQRGKWLQNVSANKLESTSRELAEVGFATVGVKEGENLEAKTRLNFVGLDDSGSFELKSDKQTRAVTVEAKPGNVVSSVVLLIEPFRANVYSANSTEADYEIVKGRVNSVSDNHIEIQPDDSKVAQSVRIDLANASVDKLTMAELQNKEVKILFVPRSSQAIKMSLLKQGSESIFYNAASAKLQEQTAASIIP